MTSVFCTHHDDRDLDLDLNHDHDYDYDCDCDCDCDYDEHGNASNSPRPATKHLPPQASVLVYCLPIRSAFNPRPPGPSPPALC